MQSVQYALLMLIMGFGPLLAFGVIVLIGHFAQ